jgi:HSP20 family protein
MLQQEWRATAYPSAAGIAGADVHEDHGFFVLRAELYDLDREHLGVFLDHGDLVVSGEILSDGLGFYRRLPLPFATDGTDLSVRFSQGLLEVRIPIPEAPETPATPVESAGIDDPMDLQVH